ncbi:MAG: beta-galactosidase, partial [Paracoccaceae bacterium]
DAAHQHKFARQGDPDFQAFHHDLYRAVGHGRWWVMEQQPGPVNWAPHNPVPLPGMVRLWSWEAFAHGAEAVCYFRWRQAQFAQEQLHAGLLRPDSAETFAMEEVRQVGAEIADAPDVVSAQAPVAIVFDYDADFAWATQPHGRDLSYFGLVFHTYKALRRQGLSVDIVPATTRNFDGYKLVMVPGLMFMQPALKHALASCNRAVVYGPRTGARNAEMAIPVPLPPDIPGLDVTVVQIESLRPDLCVLLKGGGRVICYREVLEGRAKVVLESEAGEPVAMNKDNQTYLGGWLDDATLDRFVLKTCAAAQIDTLPMPEGVRIRTTGKERFWFNYTAQSVACHGIELKPAGVLRVTL